MLEIPLEEKAEILRQNTDETEQKDKEIKEMEKQSKEADIIRREVRQVVSEFSGPLPPPSIIKGYEDVLPGAAERILEMAEKQSEHRQFMERKMISTESRDSLLGVVFAFVLGVGCLFISYEIVVNVPENAGAIASAIFGAAGIGSIVGPFLKIRRRESSERDERNKED